MFTNQISHIEDIMIEPYRNTARKAINRNVCSFTTHKFVIPCGSVESIYERHNWAKVVEP